MNAASAEVHALKLVIDGVEVPVSSGQVVFEEGQPTTATITIPMTDYVHCFKPRAAVALFRRCNTRTGSRYETNGARSTLLSSRVPLSFADARNWKDFFVGEHVAIQVVEGESRRDAVLICSDLTNYMDTIRQHHISYANSGMEAIENAFIGVEHPFTFDVPGRSLKETLWRWVLASDGTSGESNLFRAAHRVIQEMFFSCNDWYVAQYARWRFGDQFVGIPEDHSAAKLFAMQAFRDWIGNRLGGGGGAFTLRQAVETLISPVFHTLVTVPGPYLNTTDNLAGYTPAPGTEASASTMVRSSWDGAHLGRYIIKPDSWFLVPPACNVLFPTDYSEVVAGRQFLAEPTRLFLRTQALFGGEAASWLTERFFSPGFDAALEALSQGSAKAKGNSFARLRNVILPHERFTGINAIEAWEGDTAVYAQKDSRRAYLSAYTDMLFWRQRYSMRQTRITARFMPGILPGYSALVLRRPGVNDGVGRHIVGQVARVTHSVNASGVAQTLIDMVATRDPREDVDSDGKGRSLESITAQGTNAFLDDRYEPKRIGTEVYQKLFGCGSILDSAAGLVTDTDLTGPLKDVNPETHPMAYAVGVYEMAYRRAVDARADMGRFADDLTFRPQCSWPELLGTRLSGADLGADVLDMEPPIADGIPEQGFLATAFDPDAPDLQNLKPQSLKKSTTTTWKTRVLPGYDLDTPDYQNVAAQPVSDLDTSVPDLRAVYVTQHVDESSEQYAVHSYSYQNLLADIGKRLLDDMAERRKCVLAHQDTLRSRGQPG